MRFKLTLKRSDSQTEKGSGSVRIGRVVPTAVRRFQIKPEVVKDILPSSTAQRIDKDRRASLRQCR